MAHEKFSLPWVTENQVKQKIMNLDSSKATPNFDMSVNFLKSTLHIHLSFITNKFFNRKRLFS